MAERKAVNKYYPPEYDPKYGSLNAFYGQHPLRDRAKKLKGEGILVVRLEMPMPVWCLGCNELIAKGTRFNAEKIKSGEYLGIAVYSFTVKCPHCRLNKIELETDPSKCAYKLKSGGIPKAESVDEPKPEGKPASAFEVVELEGARQKQRSDLAARVDELQRLQDLQWSDNFSVNQNLRKNARQQRLLVKTENEEKQLFQEKHGLSIPVVSSKSSPELPFVYNLRKRKAKNSSIFSPTLLRKSYYKKHPKS